MYHLMVGGYVVELLVFGFWVFRYFGLLGYVGLVLMARRNKLRQRINSLRSQCSPLLLFLSIGNSVAA